MAVTPRIGPVGRPVEILRWAQRLPDGGGTDALEAALDRRIVTDAMARARG